MLHLCALLPLLLSTPLGPGRSNFPSLPQGTPPPGEQQDQGKHKTPQEISRERQVAKAHPAAPVPELLRADGSPVLPGQVPPQASADSRASWEALMDSLRGPKRMTSFELIFELRQQSQDKPQSNDVSMLFDYLAPNFLRARLESGRELLRGPAGDYLIDHDEVIHLVGREGLEDIKQINQMASIASSFVGLTDPLSLRLVDLQLIAKPEIALPPRIDKKELEGLTWIRVSSPDFYLYNAASRNPGGPERIYRADLGVHAESKAIRFAIIRDDQVGLGLPPTTMLVHMSDHLVRNRRLVPHLIEVYELDGMQIPSRFYGKPTSKLWLNRNGGSLGARLQAEHFLPPGQ